MQISLHNGGKDAQEEAQICHACIVMDILSHCDTIQLQVYFLTITAVGFRLRNQLVDGFLVQRDGRETLQSSHVHFGRQ